MALLLQRGSVVLMMVLGCMLLLLLLLGIGHDAYMPPPLQRKDSDACCRLAANHAKSSHAQVQH